MALWCWTNIFGHVACGLKWSYLLFVASLTLLVDILSSINNFLYIFDSVSKYFDLWFSCCSLCWNVIVLFNVLSEFWLILLNISSLNFKFWCNNLLFFCIHLNLFVWFLCWTMIFFFVLQAFLHQILVKIKIATVLIKNCFKTLKNIQ